MARDLPARTVLNGLETGKTGRDARGRFLPGAPPGPGRPVANPFGRYQAELRGALLAEVTPADVRTILRQVIRIAKRGHLPAVELLLRWVLGGPPPVVDPDALDADEMRIRKGKPTLVDWMSLADEQADREAVAIPATTEEEPDDADPCAPSLRTVLAWAIQELAEAQTALRTQRLPPDPVAGWEAFAASRVEFDPQAAVPIDLLYVTYARWCASHGEPVLAEDQVLAWLTAHGTTVHTGSLSGITAVEGVRVVD